jgi:drug/metabolite transporter (DMT)-like permease
MRTFPINQRRLVGYILAISGGAFSSIAPALVKIGVTSQVEPIPLLVYRFLVSVLVFWVISPFLFPKSIRISWRALKSCALVASSNTISLYAFYLAVARIDASLVLMIFSFYPLAALVFLSLRKEPINLRQILILILGLAGVYLLLDAAGPTDWIGIALALLIPVFYALHLVLIHWRLSDTAPQTIALYTITLMALFITVISMPLGLGRSSLNITGWIVILITALISTVLARLATFASIRFIGSGNVALFGPLEILIGLIWAYFLLGERLTPIQWVGGLLVVSSSTLVLISKNQKKKRTPTNPSP